MESLAHFFSLAPVFQANYFYLNEIKLSDIFTLNDEPLLFLVHHGDPAMQLTRLIASRKEPLLARPDP